MVYTTYGCSPAHFDISTIAPDGYSIYISNSPVDMVGQDVQKAIKVLVSPRGAYTSIHCSPLVTNPSGTPVARSSSIMRIAGDAFQRLSCNTLSRF